MKGYLKFLPRFVSKRIAKKLEQAERQREKERLDSSIEEFLSKKIQDEEKVPMDDMVIVSLTSYPKRIPYIKYAIYTLLNQNVKPYRVVLWLSKEEFPNKEKDLPQELLEFVKKGLEIKWCDQNLYSYKKLIPSLKEFSNSIIVTADDDILYPKDWLEKLYRAYKKDPNFIHCHRAHRITFDKQNHVKPYMEWEHLIENKSTVPSFLNFQTGGGGVLYPKNCFFEDILREDKFMQLSPRADDIWFWAMALLKGTKINVVENNVNKIQSSFMDFDEVGHLFSKNEKNNDLQLNAVFESYPELKERAVFNPSEYWEIRYKKSEVTKNQRRGKIGPSGAGSYNNLAEFKAEILNKFVSENNIIDVIEWGSGDGNQLSLAQYPHYIGIDVSQTAIDGLKIKFADDKTKEFYEINEYFKQERKKADLSISLDVIYHLIDDGIFDQYMQNLFESASKFVVIYSSNKEEFLAQHVKHRKFSDWVLKNVKGWRLMQVIPNRYPYDENNPDFTSFADFYIYTKEDK
ncbi:glycosyltransferase family 2 protein [Helicobacter sp. CaF467b]|uniref:glycosyltransferase n=1 Tax=Helicobacter sp. CaF467b TaxID=2919923 RepID=UPI001F58131F|nr:glycosyltransferase [Helicobacter sp. CaF467b]MCI2235399.1 glycosyltransferase family 2 protein [Helicobacter sp. CaF467b]